MGLNIIKLVKLSKLKSTRARIWYKEMQYYFNVLHDYKFSAFRCGFGKDKNRYDSLVIVPNEQVGIGDFRMADLEFSGSCFEELANYLDDKDLLIVNSYQSVPTMENFPKFDIRTVKKALKENPYIAKEIAKFVKAEAKGTTIDDIPIADTMLSLKKIGDKATLGDPGMDYTCLLKEAGFVRVDESKGLEGSPFKKYKASPYILYHEKGYGITYKNKLIKLSSSAIKHLEGIPDVVDDFSVDSLRQFLIGVLKYSFDILSKNNQGAFRYIFDTARLLAYHGNVKAVLAFYKSSCIIKGSKDEYIELGLKRLRLGRAKMIKHVNISQAYRVFFTSFK